MSQALVTDYSLTGLNASAAVERGQSEADWYQSPVPRAQMRRLLERRDGPALRDTLIWLAAITGAGIAGYFLWSTWWAVIPFLIYGTLYASTADARWHEAGHGTAFKTDWLNHVLYETASFMVMRESTVWRWSHTRHHSDTIIVGRDPEIAAPRSNITCAAPHDDPSRHEDAGRPRRARAADCLRRVLAGFTRRPLRAATGQSAPRRRPTHGRHRPPPRCAAP